MVAWTALVLVLAVAVAGQNSADPDSAGPHGPFAVGMRERLALRAEVKAMFDFAFGSYMQHAYPKDELKPVSCAGRGREENRGTLDDALGEFSLTLLDTLDTLLVVREPVAFETALWRVVDETSFARDVTVNLFEVTIRGLGALLSAHGLALAPPAELASRLFTVRPYRGELLALAIELGNRLLPAFETRSGIPFSRVNLLRGVLPGETDSTCTAGCGTLTLEWLLLARLSGREVFERKVRRAMRALWDARSHLDLFGNTLNVHTASWTRVDASIGAGIDSFYEYLLKAHVLFGDAEFLAMFNTAYAAVEKHVHQAPWYLPVHMETGAVVGATMDGLSAFWPGMQVLKGDVTAARASHETFYALWRRFGLMPEGFNVQSKTLVDHARHYPLRPELAESTYLLYRATRDPYFLAVGRDLIFDLQNKTRTRCGFAAVADVSSRPLTLLDRMDSFFLAETLKYLYLLFDEDSWVHTAEPGYVFTTEAHLVQLSPALLSSNRRVDGDARTGERACEADVERPFVFDFELRQTIDTRVGIVDARAARRQNAERGAHTHASELVSGGHPPSSPPGAGVDASTIFVVQRSGVVVSVPVAANTLAFEPVDGSDDVVRLTRVGGVSVSEPDTALVMLTTDQNPHSPFGSSCPDVQSLVLEVHWPHRAATLHSVASALFGPLAPRDGLHAAAVAAVPAHACTTLMGGHAVRGRVVVATRGLCSFRTKAERAAAAGAVGLLVVDHDGSSVVSMIGDAPDSTIPLLALLAADVGSELRQAVAAAANDGREVRVTLRSAGRSRGRDPSSRLQFNSRALENVLVYWRGVELAHVHALLDSESD